MDFQQSGLAHHDAVLLARYVTNQPRSGRRLCCALDTIVSGGLAGQTHSRLKRKGWDKDTARMVGGIRLRLLR